MDKGSRDDSASSLSSATITDSRDMILRHVNKNSHKISKPIRKPIPLPLPPTNPSSSNFDPNPLNPVYAQPQSQQPPVYNINKNDFRDVVQKLTGSPAHERFPTPPPPVTHPRPPSSRLQRIRPPPLSQISNRPPQLTQLLPPPQNNAAQLEVTTATQGQHFPPLPPLPSVHTAAESPISAYMRFFLSSTSSGGPSPQWNAVAPIAPRPDSLPPPTESPVSAYMRFLQSSARSSPLVNGVTPPPPSSAALPALPQQPPPSSAALPALPLSPLPFGCVPSPKSPYGMISPNFLFSPTGQLGFPQLPLSPTLPVPSPLWKGM